MNLNAKVLKVTVKCCLFFGALGNKCELFENYLFKAEREMKSIYRSSMVLVGRIARHYGNKNN